MMQFCTKTMRQQVENHKDYNSTNINVKIHNNPIEALKAIKILIHDPIASNYPYALLTSALSRFQTCKQHEDKPLLDYVKQQRDIMKTTIGMEVLNEFVEHTEEYRNETDQAKKVELKAEAFEWWCAYILIRNSDMSKYGSALALLASQFSLNNDQYPRTMTMASDFLNAHRWDKQPSSRNNSRKEGKDRKQQQGSDKSKSKVGDAEVHNTLNLSTWCYCCGDPNHKSPDCPKKDTIPKKDWAMAKAKNYLQQQASISASAASAAAQDQEDDEQSKQSGGAISALRSRSQKTSSSRRSSSKKGWNAMQVNLHSNDTRRRRDYSDSILLDSASTIDIFWNQNLVTDVRAARTMIEMATNAGTRTVVNEATVPNYGVVTFDEEAIANIFSLANMVKKKGYRVTYDSSKEDAFIVHAPDMDSVSSKHQGTVRLQA
jgi:hypothetical protein